MDLKNESGLPFTDISSELFRTYDFGDFQISIDEPCWLNVSKGGGHRILDAEGISHYIPPRWLHLFWRAKEGRPNFVK